MMVKLTSNSLESCPLNWRAPLAEYGVEKNPSSAGGCAKSRSVTHTCTSRKLHVE